MCGGFTLNYIMQGGPKYEIDLTAPSNLFGIMILLMFGCGNYLRYKKACLVTDSAYGFLTGMCFLSLWNINWVTSLRIGQRRGFIGLKEVQQVAAQQNRGPSNNRKRQRKAELSFSKAVNP